MIVTPNFKVFLGTKLEHALPKKEARLAQNDAKEFPRFDGICLFFAIDAPHKRFLFNNNWVGQPSPLKKGQPSVTSSQVANGLVSLPLRGEALAA